MTIKQEKALLILAKDIFKSALKIPFRKFHYPGVYSPLEYFVCDSFRLLHCCYFEELPLPVLELPTLL